MGQVCQRRESSTSEAQPRAPAQAKAPAAQGSKAKTQASAPPAASGSGVVDGKDAEEWKAVGNQAVKKGDHSGAYEAYSKGLRADPGHAMILSNRALSLEKLGRLEEAVDDAQRCAALRPDFVKAFLRAGTLLRELKRPVEALDILKKAPSNAEVAQLIAKVKPEAEKALSARTASLSAAERLKEEGNALFKKGSIEKALDVYTKALKSCKDQASELAIAIHNNRAGCYQQLSDFHAVVKETNVVLEHQPDNVKALLRRMLALEPLEKYEEALADARRVIQMCPANEAANKMQHRLGKVVRERKNDAKAAGA